MTKYDQLTTNGAVGPDGLQIPRRRRDKRRKTSRHDSPHYEEVAIKDNKRLYVQTVHVMELYERQWLNAAYIKLILVNSEITKVELDCLIFIIDIYIYIYIYI